MAASQDSVERSNTRFLSGICLEENMYSVSPGIPSLSHADELLFLPSSPPEKRTSAP